MHNTKIDFSSYPQQPHGGTLVNRVLTGSKQETEINRARNLPQIRIDLEAIITIEMITTGVLSPNTGFMDQTEYESVLNTGRLSNGLIWPVPLSFAPTGNRNEQVIKTLSKGDEIALVDAHNEPVAILEISDIFAYNKDQRAQLLFGTTSRDHPGVDSIYRRMGDTALAGPLTLLQRANWGPFEKLRLEPANTWHMFYEEKKFNSVAGFITGANPLHRGHEYIHKNALEEIDGLLLQPLVEMAKREYVRHEYRMLAYRSVLENYYPKNRAMLSPLRVTYIFAGPRETILHALIMKNFGCTHALIGRDHAGIGDFYDKYASHNIFNEYPPEELGIDVRLFHEVFYCVRCSGHATTETCPHDTNYRLNISGTGIREMLRHGIIPPKEVVRPESAFVAMQGVQPKGLNADANGTLHTGKVIKSLYPFYINNTGLGGTKLPHSLDINTLTANDLAVASLDARNNASKIYNDIYNEYALLLDHTNNVQRPWVHQARQTMQWQQKMVISDLQDKVSQAPQHTADEFMYQDQQESTRELQAASDLLDQIPITPSSKQVQERVWNPLPYKRYCGADD